MFWCVPTWLSWGHAITFQSISERAVNTPHLMPLPFSNLPCAKCPIFTIMLTWQRLQNYVEYGRVKYNSFHIRFLLLQFQEEYSISYTDQHTE
ncbi:hypothetical protein VIGAN_07163500 [Vigna angularis var. angularis]|uniref:Uncharacterized protein n=1 Tax=Vigna angularis var. angularis TaxID=157739 RepID=A0A0S3SIY5_PHAAN|nr:hypothetical protein VIGAN_07163500 [Vigna angularis var. angularis]